MITYITVHGTGDGERTEPDTGAPQWWRPDSAFGTDLLAAAPDGARIEPFVWSGGNSESQRRAAAERLLARLHEADRKGEDVHLIGHSHGGSVINLALRFAVADRAPLARLKGYTTIGTPFLYFRLKSAPWERFGPTGKSLMLFLALALMGAIVGLIGLAEAALTGDFSAAVFEQIYIAAGASASGACFFGLWLLRRRRRGLFGRRADHAFTARIGPLWQGFYSSHDEAIAGIRAANTIRPALFSRNILRAPMATFGLFLFLLPVALWWVVPVAMEPIVGMEGLFDPTGTPYAADAWFANSNAFVHRALGPAFAPVVQAHAVVLENLRVFFFEGGYYGLMGLDRLFGDFYGRAWPAIVGALFFAVVLIAFYSAVLAAWLFAIDFTAKRIAGPLAAHMLNASVRVALVDRVFGTQLPFEDADRTSTSPIPGREAERLPDIVNNALFEHALAGADETFRLMRQEIFRERENDSTFDPLEAAMRHVSWNELVHTAYFRVPECRIYLAAAIAGQGKA